MDFFEMLAERRDEVELKNVRIKKSSKTGKQKTPLDNLIPANPNVGRKRVRITKPVEDNSSKTEVPETIVERNTGMSNPFKNGLEFWKFYKNGRISYGYSFKKRELFPTILN